MRPRILCVPIWNQSVAESIDVLINSPLRRTTISVERIRCALSCLGMSEGNRSLIDLIKTSCYFGMHFGNFSVYSVKIGNLEIGFGCLPGNAGCIPSAVVIVTTADGMHSVFSGRHPNFHKFPILTYLYQHLTEIAEVH